MTNKAYRIFCFNIYLGLLVLLALATTNVQAAQTPDGFYLLTSADGVNLFRKDYPGGTPDYVLVADLSKQAGLSLLTADTSSAGAGQGAYAGPDPAYTLEPLDQFWTTFSKQDRRAFCVLNGGFFVADGDGTARLSFPLKLDGQLVSGGAEGGSFSDQRRMLEIWADHLSIRSLDGDLLQGSVAPQLLAGLSEDADQNPTDWTGRTFVGVADADGDGQAEQVLFLVSKTTSQADAAGVLRDFGASQVMMLAGGNATQLACGGQPYVYSDQPLPQAIGVRAGLIADFAGALSSQPDWPVVVEGGNEQITITIRNVGSSTWQPGDVSLENLRNDWGAGAKIDLSQVVPPDQKASFTWTTSQFPTSGVFTSQWNLVYANNAISEHPLTISVVVIPQALESRKAELEGQIHQWAQDQMANVEDLVVQWVQQQVHTGLESLFDKVCPSSAALPIAVMLAIFWQFHRRRPG